MINVEELMGEEQANPDSPPPIEKQSTKEAIAEMIRKELPDDEDDGDPYLKEKIQSTENEVNERLGGALEQVKAMSAENEALRKLIKDEGVDDSSIKKSKISVPEELDKIDISEKLRTGSIDKLNMVRDHYFNNKLRNLTHGEQKLALEVINNNEYGNSSVAAIIRDLDSLYGFYGEQDINITDVSSGATRFDEIQSIAKSSGKGTIKGLARDIRDDVPFQPVESINNIPKDTLSALAQGSSGAKPQQTSGLAELNKGISAGQNSDPSIGGSNEHINVDEDAIIRDIEKMPAERSVA